jgi:hypothetical protein
MRKGSRLIIVVVQQRGAVKIYVAAVEARGKNERQDKTQYTAKMDGFASFINSQLNANVLFCRCFFLISPCVCMTKLKVLVL